MTYITSFTAFIAAIVAVIAFMQWNTARQKVLLDLFEKRFEVYEQLRTVVANPAAFDDAMTFKRAKNRASFLFGTEIDEFLEITKRDLITIGTERANPHMLPPERQPQEERRLTERADRMTAFFEAFDKLVAPYMKYTQKHLPFVTFK